MAYVEQTIEGVQNCVNGHRYPSKRHYLWIQKEQNDFFKEQKIYKSRNILEHIQNKK